MEVSLLDLADLRSVRSFATRFLQQPGAALDLLVLNAGVMSVPTRELSADGCEVQFATNHLGHFALTRWLLPALRRRALGPWQHDPREGAGAD